MRPGDPGHLRARCVEELGRQSRGRGLEEVAEGPCVDGCRQEAGGLRDGLTVKSRMRQSCRGHQGSSHCPGQGPLGCFCGLDSAHISAVFARDRAVASCLS